MLLERDESNIQIGDITFCKNDGASAMEMQQASSLMAVAVSMRVDIYKLVQPDAE